MKRATKRPAAAFTDRANEISRLIGIALYERMFGNARAGEWLRRRLIRYLNYRASIYSSAQLYIWLGDLHLNLATIERYYRFASQCDPHNAEALYEVAYIEHYSKENYRGAILLLDRITIPARGLEEETYGLRAEVLSKLGRLKEAKRAQYHASRCPRRSRRDRKKKVVDLIYGKANVTALQRGVIRRELCQLLWGVGK